MAILDVTLLGGFAARLQSGVAATFSTKKVQALVAYLAMPPGRPHPRAKLAALLWGDMQEPQARASLRQAIFTLRRAVSGGDLLAQEGGALILRPEAVQIDALTFERLVDEGTAPSLGQAADLYRGPFLEGLDVDEEPFEAWLTAERVRLHELALKALARLLALRRGAGDLDGAVQAALRLLALDPTQEPVHRALMRLFAQLGRRAAALRQYQVCVETLGRELGIAPGAETRAAYEEILSTRAASPLPDEVGAAGGSPAIAKSPRAPEPSGQEPPLVGRGPELAHLGRALDHTWTGRGLVVAITGETGIGKSRLGRALTAEAFRRGALVLVGRCYQTEQILPLGAWVEPLRAVPEGLLADALDGLGAVWRVEVSRLLPELGGAAPGPDPTPGALRLFEAVAQLVQRIAARRPMVLFLEDLQWADEMSIRLLAFLGRRVRKTAALLVVTVRDEDAEAAPLLGETLDELVHGEQAIRLELHPLSRDDTVALARHLARPDGAEAAGPGLHEQVWRASDGNPFMVVETMRALAEGAPLAQTGDLPLPERVRDVVGRRLDILAESGRRLVPIAAVIGRRFDLALLRRAADASEREAAEGVEELVRHRILQGVGEELEFTHDWIREVALDRLLPPVRKGHHRRVAEAIEGLHARDLASHALALAAHYRDGEAWERAAAFFQQAGDTGFAQTGRREAVLCYEEALAAASRLPPDRAAQQLAYELHFGAARVLYTTGDFARSRESFHQAEALAQALGDDHRQARVLGGVAYLLGSEGDHAGALEAGDLALSLARSAGDAALEVWTSVALGRQHFALGGYRHGVERLTAAVDALRRGSAEGRIGPGTLLPSVGARGWLVLCLGQIGRFGEAIALGEETLRLAETLDGPQERVWAGYCLGTVHLDRGDHACARPLLEDAVALCDDGRFPIYLPRALSALGAALVRGGRLDEGLATLERAEAEASAINLLYGRALVLVQFGDACLAAGRVTEAGRRAAEALDRARTHGERGDEAWALHLAARAAGAGTPPDRDAAEGAFGRALDIAAALDMRPLAARCRLDRARLRAGGGGEAGLREVLARTIAELRAMGMAAWLPQAEALLARVG